MEGAGSGGVGNVIKDFCMCQTFVIGVVILAVFYLILGKVHRIDFTRNKWKRRKNQLVIPIIR